MNTSARLIPTLLFLSALLLALPPATLAASTPPVAETSSEVQPPANADTDTIDGSDTNDSGNTRMENLAISAATGAAIGSVWLGPGTAIGLVVGGLYGFFFK